MKNLGKLPESEYVYIIQDMDISGYYKIGRTGNVSQRMATFGVKLPFEYQVIRVIPCDNSVRLERALHNKLAHKRASGEWFKLDQREVNWLLQFDPKDVDDIPVFIPKVHYLKQIGYRNEPHNPFDYAANTFKVLPYSYSIRVMWDSGKPYFSWGATAPYPYQYSSSGQLQHIYEDCPPDLDNSWKFFHALYLALTHAENTMAKLDQEQTA